MKVAVTGCNGRVGRRVVVFALKEGHQILGIDQGESNPAPEVTPDSAFEYLRVDLRDFDATLDALRGCEAIIQLAAFPNPTDFKVQSHNSNVVISWNILRAAAELGITRVAQASTVNVITLVFSQKPKFDFFPIDESHPCLPDEPYGLSKVICEMQADTILRRYPFMRIASLRLHWSVPERATAQQTVEKGSKDLWGWLQEDSGAEAFVLAATRDKLPWSGHEAFFIAAPTLVCDKPLLQVWEEWYNDVPLREGANKEALGSFFDCSKAERLLGWVHHDYSQKENGSKD